jgi:hypothetical protein
MRHQKREPRVRRNLTKITAGLILWGFLGLASARLAVGDKWTKKADMPTMRLPMFCLSFP